MNSRLTRLIKGVGLLLIPLAACLLAPPGVMAGAQYFLPAPKKPDMPARPQEGQPSAQSPSARPAPSSPYARYMPGVVVVRNGQRLGTGFFVTAKGLVLTNRHVLGDEHEAQVQTMDGTSVRGVTVAVDAELDLALLATGVNAPSFLKLAEPGEGGVGAEVIAIGTPMGLSWSVTRGIVSGLRQAEGRHLVQTDAAINQGNSGGPLILTSSGRVVGVSTLAVRKDLAEGIGFAVSADDVRRAFGQHLE